MLFFLKLRNITSGITNSPLLKSTFIYTIGEALSKGIPFFILPIVAHYLSPADYGRLTNFSVAAQIFLAICALNTYSLLSINYHNLNKKELSDHISNSIYLIIILSSVCLLGTLLLSDISTKYLEISYTWQFLALISSFSTAVFTLYTSLLRMQNKIYLFSGFQIFQSFLSALLAVTFVVVLKWNWQGRVISIVVTSISCMLIAIILLKKEKIIFRKIVWPEIIKTFIFGIPLLPHTLSFWFKSGVDKIILTNYISLSANGIYSIALTLGGIISIFTGSFFNAYAPQMYKDLSEIDSSSNEDAMNIKRKLVKITYLYTITLVFICISSYYFLKVVFMLLFDKNYYDALTLMPFLLVTLFFDGLYSIVSGYIFYRKKTTILGMITFSSSVIQILLSLVLVKKYGIMGVLYSGNIVSFITFLSVFIYSNMLYNLPWGLYSKKVN